MIISAIAAMDRNGLIGIGMQMPWHLPSDLKRFRGETLNKPVIMGRQTFETLGRPLDRRVNIVLTRRTSFNPQGCLVARSIEDALKLAEIHAKRLSGDEAMIIGGGVIFKETVDLWDRFLLTLIEGAFQGDTHFPLHQVLERRWTLQSREPYRADSKNVYSYSFLNLERQKPDAPPLEDFAFRDWINGQSDPIASSPLTQY